MNTIFRRKFRSLEVLLNPRSVTRLSAVLLCILLSEGLWAQTSISGIQLEIGPSGSDQVTFFQNWGPVVPADYSGAIGSNNLVPFQRSLLVGEDNSMPASESLMVGVGNGESASFPFGGYQSFTLGTENYARGDYSLTAGSQNISQASNYEYTGAQCSLIVGSYNIASGDATVVIGKNNFMYGADENYNQPYGMVAIGTGLFSRWDCSLIVGRYNDTTMLPLSGLKFAIGDGADATHRSNAMEIYENGSIFIRCQGDVLMGRFGAD